MGLQNYERGNYITIYQGKFTQNVKEGTQGAITRVNKNGKTVHEKYYDSFTGKLVGIKTQDGAYGKNWVFSFKDKEDVYLLQLGYSNNYAVSILKMLPNINLDLEMKVSPKSEEKDGKTQTSLFINQNGNPVKHAYTKDKPNGIPCKVYKAINNIIADNSSRHPVTFCAIAYFGIGSSNNLIFSVLGESSSYFPSMLLSI